MKNKYFGDINDYRKYGLIRAILCSNKFNLLVAWMLTSDDLNNDGKHIDYLSKPKKWHKYDEELYKGLQQLMSNPGTRNVGLIEKTNLLPGAKYFSHEVPDSSNDRRDWFQELLSHATDSDLVFLDPDNGIEVNSKPYGRKDSSKYLYWREISDLWEQGKSLLIYQYFCREKRQSFIRRLREGLQKNTKGSLISVFKTPRVVFFLVLQPECQKYYDSIVADVENYWAKQIQLFKN
jgi:hypothetical protein